MAQKLREGATRSQWRAVDVASDWRFVTLDIDEKDPRLLAGILRDIRAMCPEPWLIVNSGSGGVHVWWALDRGYPRSAVQEVQLAAAHIFGGDLAQTGLRPSLRLPGSLNIKWDKPGVPFYECRIRQSAWHQRTTLDALRACIPKIAQRASASRGGRAAAAIESWQEAAVEAMGGESLKKKGDSFLIFDCPRCGGKGKGSVSGGRLACKSKGGKCLEGVSLEAVASEHGIAIDTEEDPRLRFLRPDLAAVIKPPRIAPFTPELREREQAQMLEAARAAFWHAQSSESGRKLWVIESGTGLGKTEAMLRYAAGNPRGVYAYMPTVRLAEEAAGRLRAMNPAVRTVVHTTPLSMPERFGKCKNIKRLRLAVENGWGAKAGCTGCPFQEECPSVLQAGKIAEGPELGDTVDFYTHATLAKGHAKTQAGKLAWVDEMPPWFDTRARLSVQHLSNLCDPALAGPTASVRGAAAELLQICERLLRSEELFELSQGMLRPQGDIFDPGEWRDVAASDESTFAVWPECYRDVLSAADALRRGGLPSDERLLIDRSGVLLARKISLPKACVLTDATFYASEILPEGLVQRIGTHIAQPGVRRLFRPDRNALRGGMRDVASATARAVAATRDWVEAFYEVEDHAPRLVFGCYKSLSDSEDFRAAVRQAAQGAAAVEFDNFERLCGTDAYADFDGALMFGLPTSNAKEHERILGAFESELRAPLLHLSAQRLLAQGLGRVRPRQDGRSTVLTVVAPYAPLASGWDEISTEWRWA